MNICVINGSPKGKYSITLQTVLFMQKNDSDVTFNFLDAGQKIKSFEKDFSEAKARLEEADLILFSYPVYTFIVPYQLHRFIELIKESEIDLSQKYTSQISTSKHFYDVTAHKFIEENVQDLDMKYVKGLSADMDDLTLEKGRKDALAFFDYLMWCVENDIYEPIPKKQLDYVPVPATTSVPVHGEEKNGDVVIVADLEENNIQLAAMIDRFRASCGYATRLATFVNFRSRVGA